MQTTPNSDTYPASVPLYVYRELATELKLTQAKLDALTQQNQQLDQQNQSLRQEITKVVQSFVHLQKLVDTTATQTIPPASKIKSHPQPTSPPQQRSSPSRPSVEQTSHYSHFSVPLEINDSTPETFLVEEQEVNYYPLMEKKVKEFSGWWLAMIILFIMLSAFSAGYLIVRPLLENQNPN
ncbi:hypothetical protein [Nodularia chucula]|uniref:hypothetical protein n=1 Tax=Nodularia chucula TaxID=3093667 RepID=UPI0039C5C449